ncbi:Protein kinase, putative [Hondaea fermentalgiana]|uniref:Protein kinase, putative n=1 Tax=Hondaea fermentalgiana TaxID=2315210 RepID=A0A2R5GA11_9STRA|nr:Protein kinase, putative [Hondaea fermentalgiana]|eukprot:GBG27415.1 Protein kinase, putative [Hondaea fermentalgiana]
MPLFTIELRSIGLEYCAEGDLASLLSRRSLYRHEIRKFASEIAYGLSFLHFHRILHEDLKPSNIGLTADFHVRISSFGCSEILLDPFEDSSGQDRFSWDIGESMSGAYKVLSQQGTLQYSSPEKVLMIPHSFEADWWSYGVVIYEMATGIVPWYAPEASELRRMICENPLTVPEGLRPELDGDTFRFVEDLIGSKDPRQRLGYRGDITEFKSHSFLIKVPEPKL